MSAHPNAGLPNELGAYDQSPEAMAGVGRGLCARADLVNIIGGCCGTTPEHIGAIATPVGPLPPRPVPELPQNTQFSGLESLTLDANRLFVNVGERTNVTGSARFRRLIAAG